MDRLLLGLLALVATGCATVHQDITSLRDVPPDSVLLVGRIELVPPLAPEEQSINMGLDPLNIKGYYLGRAVLLLSERPQYEDHTRQVANPVLEQTYFIPVPKNQRFMVRGSVTTDYSHRPVSARQSVVDQNELLIPAPIEFDIKPADRAIYVGTLRLHRDEFNEVTKAEILDHYAAVSVEFQKRFGTEAALRKALLKPVKVSE